MGKQKHNVQKPSKNLHCTCILANMGKCRLLVVGFYCISLPGLTLGKHL